MQPAHLKTLMNLRHIVHCLACPLCATDFQSLNWIACVTHFTRTEQLKYLKLTVTVVENATNTSEKTVTWLRLQPAHLQTKELTSQHPLVSLPTYVTDCQSLNRITAERPSIGTEPTKRKDCYDKNSRQNNYKTPKYLHN